MASSSSLPRSLALARECKGCPGTKWKGCHETEHIKQPQGRSSRARYHIPCKLIHHNPTPTSGTIVSRVFHPDAKNILRLAGNQDHCGSCAFHLLFRYSPDSVQTDRMRACRYSRARGFCLGSYMRAGDPIGEKHLF